MAVNNSSQMNGEGMNVSEIPLPQQSAAQAVYQAYGPEDTVLEKVVLEGVGMEITASSNPDAFAFPDASKGYKAGTVYLFGDSKDGR